MTMQLLPSRVSSVSGVCTLSSTLTGEDENSISERSRRRGGGGGGHPTRAAPHAAGGGGGQETPARGGGGGGGGGDPPRGGAPLPGETGKAPARAWWIPSNRP